MTYGRRRWILSRMHFRLEFLELLLQLLEDCRPFVFALDLGFVILEFVFFSRAHLILSIRVFPLGWSEVLDGYLRGAQLVLDVLGGQRLVEGRLWSFSTDL